MQEGQKKLLSTVAFNGINYNIIAWMQMVDPNVYLIQLIKGDWQAASPEVIGSVIVDTTAGNKARWPEPSNYVSWACGILNTEWKKEEKPSPPPEPVTWEEKLEAFILRIAFFRNADGTHTIQVV